MFVHNKQTPMAHISSNNPVNALFDVLVDVPSVERDNLKAVQDSLDERFFEFSSYVSSALGLDGLPFLPDAEEVEEPLMGADTPLLIIHENVQQAIDGLRVLGLHINESLPLANLPYDQMTEVTKEAMSLCAEVSQRMVSFIEHLHEICLAVPPLSEPIPISFSNVIFSSAELYDIHESLVKNYWIEPHCSDVDFVFFFSGEGLPPRTKIGWVESSVLLGIFLKEMTDEIKVWQKASRIFLVRDKKTFKYQPVKSRSLCANYTNSLGTDVFPANVAKVRAILGK